MDHREASRWMWSDPELDFRRGSWGQGRKQEGQEERLEPPPPILSLNARVIRFFLKEIVGSRCGGGGEKLSFLCTKG